MITEGVGELIAPLYYSQNEDVVPQSVRDLMLGFIPFETARKLNRCWHSRFPGMGIGFVSSMPFLSYGACSAQRIFAIAIWSHPLARNLPQREWLELRRLAIGPQAPHCTASWMLGAMARDIQDNRPEITRLISYQDMDVHSGGIYRAAGWVPGPIARAKNWGTPSRHRPPAQALSAKVRWEKKLLKKRRFDD